MVYRIQHVLKSMMIVLLSVLTVAKSDVNAIGSCYENEITKWNESINSASSCMDSNITGCFKHFPTSSPQHCTLLSGESDFCVNTISWLRQYCKLLGNGPPPMTTLSQFPKLFQVSLSSFESIHGAFGWYYFHEGAWENNSCFESFINETSQNAGLPSEVFKEPYRHDVCGAPFKRKEGDLIALGLSVGIPVGFLVVLVFFMTRQYINVSG